MKYLLISSLMTSVMATPIVASAATEFYVAQDAKTHVCSVVMKKPDGKMAMDVGTKVYATQADAEKAKANLKSCK